MKMTSLCYIEEGGKYLMLHRVKKENDENRDKWIGIGGNFEYGESPEDCANREILEETGLTVGKLEYRGIVTFISDEYGTEYMHLFRGTQPHGNLRECDEGILEWIDKDKLYNLPMWEGDRIFLDLLNIESTFFSLKLTYSGSTLINAVLNGREIPKKD